MSRLPSTTTINTAEVEATPLPFREAQALLPTVAQLMSEVFDNLGPAIASGRLKLDADTMDPAALGAMLPALGGLGRFLEGKLDKLAPRILATTVVIVDTGKGKEKFELNKLKEREELFDERPDLYFPVLIWSGRLTFQRFFPAKEKGENDTKEE